MLAEVAVRLVALFAGAHRIPRLFPVSEPHAVCFFLSLGFLFLSDVRPAVRWLIAGASLAGVLADYRVRGQLVDVLKLWQLEPPASLVTFVICDAGKLLTILVLALGLEAFYRAGNEKRQNLVWSFRVSAFACGALCPFTSLFSSTYSSQWIDLVVPFALVGCCTGFAALGAMRDLGTPDRPRDDIENRVHGDKALLGLSLSLLMSASLLAFVMVLGELRLTFVWSDEAVWQAFTSSIVMFGLLGITFPRAKARARLALPVSLFLLFVSQITRGFSSDIACYVGLASLFLTPIFFGEGLRGLAMTHHSSAARNFRKGGVLLGISTLYVVVRCCLYYRPADLVEVALWSALTLAFGYFLVGSLSWLVQLARGQGFTHREDRSACPTSHLSPSKPEAPQDAQLGCRKISCV